MRDSRFPFTTWNSSDSAHSPVDFSWELVACYFSHSEIPNHHKLSFYSCSSPNLILLAYECWHSWMQNLPPGLLYAFNIYSLVCSRRIFVILTGFLDGNQWIISFNYNISMSCWYNFYLMKLMSVIDSTAITKFFTITINIETCFLYVIHRLIYPVQSNQTGTILKVISCLWWMRSSCTGPSSSEMGTPDVASII